MKVWALWHGGSNYSQPEHEDLEEFRSLMEAGEEFRNRAENWGSWGDFAYVAKPPRNNVLLLCVSAQPPDLGGPSMQAFLRDPREEWKTGEARPDRIVEFGPRGELLIAPPKDEAISPGTQTVVSALPHCDIHTYEKHQPGVEAHYDGKTRRGPWAFMCETCFVTHGVGLGVGRGQQLVVREDQPATGYHCGMCAETFPPGVTGHTDDNPCEG